MSLSSELSAWNQQRKKDLVSSYDRKGFRASGKWSRDLTPKEQVTPFKVNVKMLGSDYTYYMINGRKAGKWPPIDAIRQWVEDKKINISGDITKDQLVYLIGRKIATKGIKPTAERKRLLTDVYTKERINEVVDIIKNNTLFDIKKQYIKILQ